MPFTDASDGYREYVKKYYTKQPVLDYGDSIYDAYLRSESDSVENFQRKAALVCTGAFRITLNDRLLNELGWQKIENNINVLMLKIFL